MMMRGTVARALPLCGGLAILGVGVLLLPLMQSWAQAPLGAGQLAAAQDSSQSDQIRDKIRALEKAQADIRRMQEEVERARQDLERRTQDLNRKLDQIRKAASDAANTPLPVERKSSAPKGVHAGQRSAS